MYTYTFITYTSLPRRGPCDAERVEYVHPYHLVRVRVRIIGLRFGFGIGIGIWARVREG